ncbi:MAG: 3-dehydroquinate synthase [Chthoniobacter sp.]|nr:3-dehydroquinate synthase [Chthoniobacter sp.]
MNGSATAGSAAGLSLEEALRSARETRALLVGAGVLRETARIFREQFPGCNAVVVADEQTYSVAAKPVAEALQLAGVHCVKPFIFKDPALYAEMRFVEELEASLGQHDAVPIAVGSGTVNDLTKLAAHRVGRPGYLSVATAASMDGYTAFGASITYRGAKQTFDCPAPRAVIADIDIIRRAPPEMTASGYADLAAKLTAGADWILADALGVEPIDPRAWAIVQGGLRDGLADPVGAQSGDAAAITPLVEGLMLGGFAMQWSKSSRPASGAEHQFSHLWDMEHHVHDGIAPSHGFKVGVATLAITRLYEHLLAYDVEALNPEPCVEFWPEWERSESLIRQRFAGTDFIETAVAESRAKYVSGAVVREQLGRLKACWPELRERLAAQLMPSAELKRRLQLVGAPTEPEQIGISRERLRETFTRACSIRRRFTILDLSARVGSLSASPLFLPGAPWEIPRPSRRYD